MTNIEIQARDNHGSFMAYMAKPENILDKMPAPVIIVIQEIFGVNEEMRRKCDSLAKEGFIAVCPDIFWRLEPGIELTDKTEEEWAKAFDCFNRFDIDKGIEDLQAVENLMRNHPDCNGKIGTIGFCLGGKLAYLMASRTSIDCSVSFYGVGLDELLDEADHIKKPIMLHIAEEDKFVSKEAQAIIKSGLSNHPLVKIHSYPGVNHAFARGDGEFFDEEAATCAQSRTLDFIRNNLAIALAA